LTLGWALSRRAAARARAPAGVPEAQRRGTVDPRALTRALAHSDLADVAAARCALAGVGDLDAVRARLDDDTQRRAVDALQQARWGSGDGAQARARLREAFRAGPRWRHRAPEAKEGLLPPLYPG
ncbi:MAG TPA: protein BatD, partial [Xanthomonadaceae bacterium]|nr:protein BatD [Xanthomonadaceae bacterium]